MFVRSYMTYISPYTSTKTTPQREESSPKKTNSFSLETKKEYTSSQTNLKQVSLKESYLPSYAIFRQQQSNKDLNKFEAIKNYQDAKVAYKENSFMYSLAQKPKIVIGGTKIDLQLPKEAQEAKTSLSKKEMVNTYVENENYYRITAA